MMATAILSKVLLKPIPFEGRFRLMAYEARVGRKLVYIGFTITPDPTKITAIGQDVLNAITHHSTGRIHITLPRNRRSARRTFVAALKAAEDGDAIFVMAAKDGLMAAVLSKITLLDTDAQLAPLPEPHGATSAMWPVSGTVH